MRIRDAKKITTEALSHLRSEHPETYDWAKTLGFDTFERLTARQFLSSYCYCIYTAGMNIDVVQAKFPAIKKAFKNFVPDEIKRMRSVKPVLSVINHESKANGFLKGAKTVLDEGFGKFKVRLLNAYQEGKRKENFSECLRILRELPWSGPVIARMLAKNIGLIDTAKDDRWLKRAANLVDASVDEFSSSMSRKFSLSEHLIDVAIFQYGKDKKFGGRPYKKSIR